LNRCFTGLERNSLLQQI